MTTGVSLQTTHSLPITAQESVPEELSFREGFEEVSFHATDPAGKVNEYCQGRGREFQRAIANAEILGIGGSYLFQCFKNSTEELITSLPALMVRKQSPSYDGTTSYLCTVGDLRRKLDFNVGDQKVKQQDRAHLQFLLSEAKDLQLVMLGGRPPCSHYFSPGNLPNNACDVGTGMQTILLGKETSKEDLQQEVKKVILGLQECKEKEGYFCYVTGKGKEAERKEKALQLVARLETLTDEELTPDFCEEFGGLEAVRETLSFARAYFKPMLKEQEALISADVFDQCLKDRFESPFTQTVLLVGGGNDVYLIEKQKEQRSIKNTELGSNNISAEHFHVS